jgi:hypothetical protein
MCPITRQPQVAHQGFSLSFKLPVGGSKDLITADNSGIKFPALPFIPAINTPSKP